MEIVFLGTSSMVPTKERNQSAIIVRKNADTLLIDCGEGTQRQMQHAGISLAKINHILISHWHGDHVLGLPGLLQSINAIAPSSSVHIYGPKQTKKFIELLLSTFIFERRIEIEVHEIEKGVFLETDELLCSASLLKHNTTTLGFRIEEKEKLRVNMKDLMKFKLPGPLIGKISQGKDVRFQGKEFAAKMYTKKVLGKKIAIISDTLFCKEAVAISKHVDIVISESTYDESLAKKAREHFHLTAAQAALITKQAKAKKLILTHFSARYKKTEILELEAKKIFKNTSSAADFLRIEV